MYQVIVNLGYDDEVRFTFSHVDNALNCAKALKGGWGVYRIMVVESLTTAEIILDEDLTK